MTPVRKRGGKGRARTVSYLSYSRIFGYGFRLWPFIYMYLRYSLRGKEGGEDNVIEEHKAKLYRNA